MNKYLRIFFIGLLVFFVYHLMRDMLQIYGTSNFLTQIGHTKHFWCKDYCNQVTLIPEIFGIIASVLVIKNKRVGVLGFILLTTLPIWLLFQFLP